MENRKDGIEVNGMTHAMRLAEEILEILSSSYFVSILNQHSEDLLEPVGDMVLRFWKETTRVHTVSKTRSDLHREIDQLKDAVKWALGESGDFGPRPKRTGAYWWRKGLRQRSGIFPNTKLTHQHDQQP